MTGRMLTYGIVRIDRSSPDTTADAVVEAIHEFAHRHALELHNVSVVHSDADLSVLLASFRASGIGAVLVPSVLHLTGWLDTVRSDAEVWTLNPPACWPRRPDTDAANHLRPNTRG